MRRSTLLWVIGAVLVIGIGAYSVFWWVAAGRIAEEVAKAAQSARAQGIYATWTKLRVTGYPFVFRADLNEVAVRAAGGELRAPHILVTLSPWELHAARFAAPNGIEATPNPAGAADAVPLGPLHAATAGGAVAMAGDGQRNLWLSLYDVKAGDGQISARVVHSWVSVPPAPPTSHTEPGFAAAALLWDLDVPTAPPGFGKSIGELAFGATLMGAWPHGALRQAAIAWRDAGGTVELDHFRLMWGETIVNASGTLALDKELQPVGGFSGGISGYDQLMAALVAAGRVKSNDARLARLGLALIAKAGPDGRPEISTALTIQNGELSMGPAKLGKVPRINW